PPLVLGDSGGGESGLDCLSGEEDSTLAPFLRDSGESGHASLLEDGDALAGVSEEKGDTVLSGVSEEDSALAPFLGDSGGSGLASLLEDGDTALSGVSGEGEGKFNSLSWNGNSVLTRFDGDCKGGGGELCSS
ncbi:hypothetical protein C0992_012304, partial [Termitomyces sp. T32_za158]